MNRCKQERWLSAYLDGELEESSRLTEEEHLRSCPGCLSALHQLAEMRDLLSVIPVPEHSAAYWQAFEVDLRTKRARCHPARANAWHMAWRSVFALVVLFALSLGIASGSVSPTKAEILSNVPGATVYLDGQVVGITPLHLMLPAGSHQLSLHKEGFRIWEEAVMALASAPLRLEVKLASLSSQPDSRREGLQQFSCPEMSPDGETVAFLGSKEDFRAGTGELWLSQASRGQVRKMYSNLAIVPPCWSPDGKRLAYVLSGATGDTLTVWDRDRNVTLTASPELALTQLAWLGPDKIIYLSGSDSHLTQWDIFPARSHALLSSPVEQFVLSPDGKWAAYLSASDGRVYLLSLETGVNKAVSPPGRESFGLAWSPSGKELALATHDGLFLLDLAGESESILSPLVASDLLWLKEGSLLFLEQAGQSLWRWDPGVAEPFLLYQDAGRMGALSLCPDGSTFLYSSDASGFRRLWRGDLSGPAISNAPYLSGSRLALSSQPLAAEVYIEGAYLGRTPTTVSLAEAGQIHLTLKKEKYQDWRLDLNLVDGETREVVAAMLSSSSPQHALSALDGEMRQAAFSPDGHWLALVCGSAPNPELWLMSMENQIPKLLGEGQHPVWSEDSQHLFFDRGGSNSDIWVHTLTNGESIQLTHSGAAQNPSISPQGGWVAYLQGLDPAHLELWLMNADGGDARLLTQDDHGQIFGLAWSPEGSEILYLVRRNGIDEAHLIDLEGKERTLASGEQLSAPTWSPAGDLLVFQIGTDGKSELQFYRYPELQFYSSLPIPGGSTVEPISLFWSASTLHWFQENASTLQATRYTLAQGIPEVEASLNNAHFLAFLPSLQQMLVSADWNGTSQVYLIPIGSQAP
jgi:Tol biopolymer transport system component